MKCLLSIPAAAAVLVVIAAAAPQASATTIGVTVADASTGNYTLTSVSVTRGAAVSL